MLRLSLFDIVDCLPRTDCGSCISGNCTEFARRLQNEEAQLEECHRLFTGSYEEELAEIREMLSSAEKVL